MGLPSDYKIADGCWNCDHSFRRTDFEEGYAFFCCQDGSTRPLCNSHSMGEGIFASLRKQGIDIGDPGEYEKYEELATQWETWADAHAVKESGICSRHKLLEGEREVFADQLIKAIKEM